MVDAPDERARHLADRREQRRRRAPARGRAARAAAARRASTATSGRRARSARQPTCVSTARSAARYAGQRDARTSAGRSSPVLELVPARRGEELEQRAAAVRVGVREVLALVVPVDFEQAFLDAVVEPGAAEDELLEPVDERLAARRARARPSGATRYSPSALRGSRSRLARRARRDRRSRPRRAPRRRRGRAGRRRP